MLMLSKFLSPCLSPTTHPLSTLFLDSAEVCVMSDAILADISTISEFFDSPSSKPRPRWFARFFLNRGKEDVEADDIELMLNGLFLLSVCWSSAGADSASIIETDPS